jgi:hypothetical protein
LLRVSGEKLLARSVASFNRVLPYNGLIFFRFLNINVTLTDQTKYQDQGGKG